MSLHLVSDAEPSERDVALKEAAARTHEAFDDIEAVITRCLTVHVRDEVLHFENGPLTEDRDVYPLDLWPEDAKRRLRYEEAVALAVDAMMSELYARVPDVRRAFMGDII